MFVSVVGFIFSSSFCFRGLCVCVCVCVCACACVCVCVLVVVFYPFSDLSLKLRAS